VFAVSAGRLVLAFVLLRCAVACSGECRSPVESGPGATGSITYVEGDGRSATSVLVSEVEVSNDELALTGAFQDADRSSRGYTLTLTGLAANTTTDLRGHGQICFAREQNGAAVCADVTGSIVLGALSADCSKPTAGIYSCAESVTATLSVQSAWSGTAWSLGATLSTSGRWASEKCED
jgi:hypothetical protein